MNIRFAPELKNQITKIEPNLIHNRFDLLFGDDWEMILIDNNILVPFHIENNSGRVGLYLRDIGGAALQTLKSFLFEKYPGLIQIFFLHTYTDIDGIEPAVHWHIDLPNTMEEFDAALGKDVRRNSRRYPRYIREQIGEYTIDKIKPEQCTDEIMQMYLDWKKQSHGFVWNRPPREYLNFAGISDVYIMHTNAETLAIGFVCDTGGEMAFYDNFAYTPKYRTYSLGIVLYHAIIADMVARGKKRFCLLGGNLEYKRSYNGVATMTRTGLVWRDPEIIKQIDAIAPKIRKIPVFNYGRKRIAVIYSWLHKFPKYCKNILKTKVTK